MYKSICSLISAVNVAPFFIYCFELIFLVIALRKNNQELIMVSCWWLWWLVLRKVHLFLSYHSNMTQSKQEQKSQCQNDVHTSCSELFWYAYGCQGGTSSWHMNVILMSPWLCCSSCNGLSMGFGGDKRQSLCYRLHCFMLSPHPSFWLMF